MKRTSIFKGGLRVDAGKLRDILDNHGITNTSEICSGTCTNPVADRFQNYIMPFFSKNLCSGKNCQCACPKMDFASSTRSQRLTSGTPRDKDKTGRGAETLRPGLSGGPTCVPAGNCH